MLPRNAEMCDLGSSSILKPDVNTFCTLYANKTGETTHDISDIDQAPGPGTENLRQPIVAVSVEGMNESAKDFPNFDHCANNLAMLWVPKFDPIYTVPCLFAFMQACACTV